jgi:hypothetical protein
MKRGSKHTPESIEKLRISHTGKKLPLEQRIKIGIASTGRKHTQEAKDKISASKRGISTITEYQREILRECRKQNPFSPEHYTHLHDLFVGRRSPMKGRKHSDITKAKISASNIGRVQTKETRLKISEKNRGSNGGNWLGGISFEPYCERFNDEFKDRVREFWLNICFECGKIQGSRKLHVHHIHYNKKMCCDGSIQDVVPLCHSCHAKTNHDRDYWENHLTKKLYDIHPDGKCFFTKSEYKTLVIKS